MLTTSGAVEAEGAGYEQIISSDRLPEAQPVLFFLEQAMETIMDNTKLEIVPSAVELYIKWWFLDDDWAIRGDGYFFQIEQNGFPFGDVSVFPLTASNSKVTILAYSSPDAPFASEFMQHFADWLKDKSGYTTGEVHKSKNNPRGGRPPNPGYIDTYEYMTKTGCCLHDAFTYWRNEHPDESLGNTYDEAKKKFDKAMKRLTEKVRNP